MISFRSVTWSWSWSPSWSLMVSSPGDGHKNLWKIWERLPVTTAVHSGSLTWEPAGRELRRPEQWQPQIPETWDMDMTWQLGVPIHWSHARVTGARKEKGEPPTLGSADWIQLSVHHFIASILLCQCLAAWHWLSLCCCWHLELGLRACYDFHRLGNAELKTMGGCSHNFGQFLPRLPPVTGVTFTQASSKM